MSKSNPPSKIKRNQAKRLSSTKRKQELENVNLIDSKTKAFKNYDKVKRMLEINMSGIEREKQGVDQSGITSPHFYKPQKNKLFYIPSTNNIRKSHSKTKERSNDSALFQNKSNYQIKKHMLTEVNSPLYQPDFNCTISPSNNTNDKYTTEEDDITSEAAAEFFSKTAQNKINFKELFGK